MGQWVTFQNETSTRLVAASNLVVNDNLEKSIVKGDFNRDGWMDVAVARKFPGSIQGGFRNILFMNENGVLVDRTEDYATASDVPGDQGFLEPTNDRDVLAIDVNLDGWLDLVTSTTMSDQVSTLLGQPRVYINLGNDGNGEWLGFRFEDARIPELKAKNGSTANPRFCDFGFGDVTGDGYPDLFFADYDTPETSGTVCIDLNQNGNTSDPGECQQSPAETPSKDFDNKLLINDGNGFFVDSTTTRMTSSQLASAFGNAAFMADMNGDGLLDVVRINTLTGGQNVAILYPNNPQGTSWTGPVSIYGNAPYHTAPADINNDGKMDLCVIDDAKDRFLINTGNNVQGQAQFTTYTINDSLSEFGNKPSWADLDNDGFVDLMVADVDSDLPPFCPSSGRRAKIYRNTLGVNPVISNNTLDEIGQVIPNASLNSTFDLLPIDLNNDGWLDLVIGRCSGIQVWMNVPPLGVAYSYPNGRPEYLVPEETTTFDVQTAITGGGSIVPGTALLFYSVDNGAFESAPLADQGSGLYTATLPAVSCRSSVRYYLSGDLSNGPIFTDPPTAPAATFSASAIDSIETVFEDGIEGSVVGWSVVNTSVTSGGWVAVDPIGTVNSGAVAQPENAFEGTKCWITGNGVVGGSATAADLDGGPTVLTSPTFGLEGQDGVVSYARWFYCDDVGVTGADSLIVQVSNDNGANWVIVETVTTNAGEWVPFSFTVGDFVTPTATMQVRWVVSDNPNNSVTEAGVDAFLVEVLSCTVATPCPADLSGDGVVDGGDLGILLAQWGGPGSGDLDGSGVVDGADLGSILASFGPCPE
jgi:hypothetical protein